MFKSSKGCEELFSDLDSKATEGEDEDLYLSTFSQNFHSESEITPKGNQKTAIELDANILTESVHSLPEAASMNAISLSSHFHLANVFTPNSDSDESTEALPEPVVLAYNPSLKKKLSESIYRRHQRSASDFVEQEVKGTEGTLHDTEPVPLDPIVHPPEGQYSANRNEGKPVSLIPNQRSLKRVTDVSPLHERVTPNLASKNLLVKVVKADFIDLKSSSNAYCVVELDEPYQRHATHVVPPSEQLFWDQHLLFGLNSNSKRAAFEVFELSKRRKSISRGYAEVYLPELLTSSVRGCSSELLRCIPLDSKQHSSSTLGIAASVGGSGGGKWEYTSNSASSSTSLTIRRPTVTAEFHFMERIVDDPFSICKGRSGVGSPTPLSKLHAVAMVSPTSSSDSSLSQTAGATASDTTGTGVGTGADRASHGSKGSFRLRRAVTFNSGRQEGVEDNEQLEFETPKDVTPTPRTESSKQYESRLQRSTSTRGSRLFEPAFENLRLADTNAALTSRQQYGHRVGGGLGGLRRKSVPRAPSSGLGGGGFGGSSSITTGGFGLLGPSSQLAGVVAGLTAASVESSDASVDPSTAAAVASAVAVAAATGRSTSASAALDRRVMVGGAGGGGVVGLVDSLFENTAAPMTNPGIFEHEPLTDAVVRYAAPAANVAESLGTYSAQLPPRRTDTAGAKLISLFKSKKKHQQPSGMARLLYLQNLEVNPKYLAIITETSGGGGFTVIPIKQVGRMPSVLPMVAGHTSAVLDIQWCPHNNDVIASASDDCTVKIWEIPKGGIGDEPLTESIATLIGHQRRVYLVVWHPTAQGVIASSSADNMTILWDSETQSQLISVEFPNLVTCLSFNYNGSKLAACCKDGLTRIVDPRTGAFTKTGNCHEGKKPQMCVFVEGDRLFTTGFSRMSERQLALWDSGDLSKCLWREELDITNGILFPFYDIDTNLIFVCGKGDSSVRYFEYSPQDKQRGFAFMPKLGLNVATCEIARMYKLHNKNWCEVISFTVPRKSGLFQEDLYPDTVAPIAALSCNAWFWGQDADPIKVSVKEAGNISKPGSSLQVQPPSWSVSMASSSERAKVSHHTSSVVSEDRNGPTASSDHNQGPLKCMEMMTEMSRMVGKLSDQVKRLEHRVRNLEERHQKDDDGSDASDFSGSRSSGLERV
ncbi:Coronin-1B [Taenia crassiceps]|uniref:Coronin n=1 Tax=Taenia crassiceps TaxID=6207 RepID=A0ABR4QKI8_9CEST